VKYQIAYALKQQYSVTLLCWYLGCSSGGYYDWINRGKPHHNKVDDVKTAAILTIYH